MALKAEHVIAPRKRLVFASRRGGKMRGAGRKVEGVAVPMEHRGMRAVEMAQRRSLSSGGQRERAPAELLGCRRIDARPEHARDQLRAEADAERRKPGCD